jgi:hypothetical protein
MHDMYTSTIQQLYPIVGAAGAIFQYDVEYASTIFP